MTQSNIISFLKNTVNNLPKDWINLTTHRLDIYNEEQAKTEFLVEFEKLYSENNTSEEALSNLPTAYDYIRLGHPLSTVLEWALAKIHGKRAAELISFSSQSMPVLAILRSNLLSNKKTRVLYQDNLPSSFNKSLIEEVYSYQFQLENYNVDEDLTNFEGSTVLITDQDDVSDFTKLDSIDFVVKLYPNLGSVIYVKGKNESYISEIQHVRRRESIAMTPQNCLLVLQNLIENKGLEQKPLNRNSIEKNVVSTIQKITQTKTNAVIASSGLSMQYAIMMGLIDNAQTQYPNKAIKIIVPPNCYGGTNDQARRVADCLSNVEILDLPVDGENDMVNSTEKVLAQVAKDDAVPLIIAEIPTNPRVEVPELKALANALEKKRKTSNESDAIAPIFILDQTFCPNYPFLDKDGILSNVQVLSYVSGSKFPSGGKCTAGYCAANDKAEHLMPHISKHLLLCDNQATTLQLSFLEEQMPSMLKRIDDAYSNTREFVNFIEEVLPEAKINFVSEDLAHDGFTPSVFSLDLPTKGNTPLERENHKRSLNLKLIDLMISEIPNESKYCVSYGQLKGCYWTIPATSTQGTTKESDKDYIARVSVSGDLDLDKHKAVFQKFVENEIR